MEVRVVVADIDGTLTRRRGDLLISLEAVEAVRLLESSGIRVSLATGNSVPVAAGLARYIGASGPVIAENGCVVFDQETWSLYHLCRGKPPQELARELASLGLRESWQNPYRHHDLAFQDPRRDPTLRRVVEEKALKYGDFVVIATGYAYHIAPAGASKARGVREALRILGASKWEALGVGDGENDLPLFEGVGYSAAPADADPLVKARVDYVASQPAGRGFAEIARLIVKGELPARRS